MKRLLCLFLLLTGIGLAQPDRYVLVNGTIHTAVREPFQGYVVVAGDRIEQVGEGSPPAGNHVDLAGAHLYPALIDADSALGLVGVESLRATRDNREVGLLNQDPDCQASSPSPTPKLAWTPSPSKGPQVAWRARNTLPRGRRS